MSVSHWESIDAETRRIETLAVCAMLGREGGELGEVVKARLADSTAKVRELRKGDQFKRFAAAYRLDGMDCDILFAAIAPLADPQVGWAFQSLQAGVAGPWVSPALLREMLGLDERESALLASKMGVESPLARAGLIEAGEAVDHYRPVKVTARAAELMLGWEVQTKAPVGAVRVSSAGSWDDLLLPESCFARLREFTHWIFYREKVYGEWGASRSGGPVALFSGPPGTGKTFAASIISSELGWSLLRVDLGAIVSKYVGETEKNLNAVFEAASGEKVLLLFDEADALFGKRSEVRDARDRYANMEVSHLLSRIELHDGPCILTTNLRANMDGAFVRRFHVVADFPLPDEAMRARLWAKYLPPRAPLAEEIKPDTLAAAVKMSASQIRNACVQAAFLAAAERSPRIGLEHVARAVWRELHKEG